MFGEEFIKGYKFCHGKYWSEDEKQLSKRMMGAWAYFAKVSFLPFVQIRMQCASIWKYFRLEILDLKISKISSRANPHMSFQHQLINQLTLKTMKKILSSFTNDIFSLRVRKYITLKNYQRIVSIEHMVDKLGCVFPIIVVSILSHAEFVSNNHREDASHFI